MIRAGELSGTLPGERTLAGKLQIGRDTLRAALEILESRKVISTREHGKRRTILRKGGGKRTSRALRVAFLSPKELRELPPDMLVEFDTLRGLLNSWGFELELVHPRVFHLNDPSRRLAKITRDSHYDVWILYQCPMPVQQWFHTNKIPAIVRGYSGEGIDIPSLDEDWRATAFHAGGVLSRAGHRSIGLLMPDTKLAGLKATETGLCEALEQAGAGGTLHTLFDSLAPGSTARALERALSLDNPPTAIVGTRSRHTLSMVSCLAQHGLAIPRDLSYLSLTYEQWYCHLTPRISHYHTDPTIFARTMVRKILAHHENRKIRPLRLIMPEYVPGDSVSNHR